MTYVLQITPGGGGRMSRPLRPRSLVISRGNAGTPAPSVDLYL